MSFDAVGGLLGKMGCFEFEDGCLPISGVRGREESAELKEPGNTKLEAEVSKDVLDRIRTPAPPCDLSIKIGLHSRDIVGKKVCCLLLGNANVVQITAYADGRFTNRVLIRPQPYPLIPDEVFFYRHAFRPPKLAGVGAVLSRHASLPTEVMPLTP